MRDLVLAIVISVLISAGITYWMVGQLREERASVATANLGPAAPGAATLSRRTDPTIVAIQVSSAGGNRCTANTDPKRKSYGAGPVHWVITRRGNVTACFANGETVKIVPKSGNTSPLTPSEPYDAQLIEAEHGNTHADYFYEVWMASKVGANLYKMEDPELEIIEVRGAGQQ